MPDVEARRTKVRTTIESSVAAEPTVAVEAAQGEPAHKETSARTSGPSVRVAPAPAEVPARDQTPRDEASHTESPSRSARTTKPRIAADPTPQVAADPAPQAAAERESQAAGDPEQQRSAPRAASASPRARIAVAQATDEPSRSTRAKDAPTVEPAPERPRAAQADAPTQADATHQSAGADDTDKAATAKAATAARLAAARGWVARTFPGHEHAFWGGVIALVVALLVFVIGLWRVVFIGIVVFVGVAVGQVFDGDPKVVNAIRRLIDGDRGQG